MEGKRDKGGNPPDFSGVILGIQGLLSSPVFRQHEM